MKTIKELKALASNGIITHAGIFHADDVLCAALLDIFEVVEYDHLDVIKRVSKVPEGFQGLAFDIGGGLYDHHQQNAEVRVNGVKYAALGLLWREFGMDYLQKFCSSEEAELAWVELDEQFIQAVDLTDNFGQAKYPNPLAYLVSARAATHAGRLDEEFIQTVKDIIPFLDDAINRAIEEARNSVKAKRLAEEQGSVVVLDNTFIPAKCFVGTSAEYIVSKSNRGDAWNINCVPGHQIKFDQKDMAGCTFVHPAKFIAAFATKHEAVYAANAMVLAGDHN